RILTGADVVPGPAVEATVAHAGDVVRRQIVAEPVALVDRGPEFAGRGVDRQADRIADAGGEAAHAAAVRIEFQNVGAQRFVGAVADVGGGAHRHEHLAAVPQEGDV